MASPADDTFPPIEFAKLVASEISGAQLERALEQQFPTIPRADIYFAIRLAHQDWTAALVEARAERDAARLDLDSAQLEMRWLRAQLTSLRTTGGAWRSWLKEAAA